MNQYTINSYTRLSHLYSDNHQEATSRLCWAKKRNYLSAYYWKGIATWTGICQMNCTCTLT